MSGVVSLIWHGSPVGAVMAWALPQFLLHLYPCTSNCGSKILDLDWCPNPITGRHAWLQEVAISSSIFPISRSLPQAHPHRFLGISLLLGFQFIPEMIPLFQVSGISSRSPHSFTCSSAQAFLEYLLSKLCRLQTTEAKQRRIWQIRIKHNSFSG